MTESTFGRLNFERNKFKKTRQKKTKKQLDMHNWTIKPFGHQTNRKIDFQMRFLTMVPSSNSQMVSLLLGWFL